MVRKIANIVGCLLAIPLTCAACIGLGWVYNYYITEFGRITDFKPLVVPGDTPLPGTDYTLHVVKDDFFLKHISVVHNPTGASREFLLAMADEAYTTFEHDDHLYLILRSLGGGTNTAYDYVVVDLTTNTPRRVGYGQACSNPKRDGDRLEFYRVDGKCDFFPFGRSTSTWEMELSEPPPPTTNVFAPLLHRASG